MQDKPLFSINKESFVKVKPNTFSMSLAINAEDTDKKDVIERLNRFVGEFEIKFSQFSDKLYDVKKSYSVYEARDRSDRRKFVGTQSVSFNCDDVEQAKIIFDTLSVLKHVQVHPPIFNVKNVSHHEKELLQLAFAEVKKQAMTECEIMGVPFYSVEIMHWDNSFSYPERSQSRGVIRAASMEVNSARNSVDTENLSFDPLDIEVSLYLNVEFKKIVTFYNYGNVSVSTTQDSTPPFTIISKQE